MSEEKMETMKNRKKILISVVAVILLVVAIVVGAYAIFTANLTGTKENKLTTGDVSLNCDETNFTLNNTKTLTDAQGIALNDNSATCTLTSTMRGTMKLGYDIALYDITPSATITTSDVKIQVSRTIDGGTATYPQGTTNTGVLLSSLSSVGGQYDESITSYNVDSNTLIGNHEIVYTIKGWLAAGGVSTLTNTTTNGVCSDTTYTTEQTCKAAGEIWGDEQESASPGGTFSFKLKLGATQVFPTTGN